MYLQKQLNGCSQLSEWVFSAFVNQLMALFNNESYESAVAKLVQRLNWNAGTGCRALYNFSEACFSQTNIENTINAYGNAVLSGAISEYDRKNAPTLIDFIERYVSKNSGVSLAKVKAILYNLYFGTQDGSIKNKAILMPQTNKIYLKNQEIPTEYDETKLSNTIEFAGFSLNTILWTAGAVAVVGGGLYLYTLSKIR